MSTSEREVVEPRAFSSSHPPASGPSSGPPPPNNVAIIDIGSFVANYNKMVGVLYPLELVCTAVLYVVR